LRPCVWWLSAIPARPRWTAISESSLPLGNPLGVESVRVPVYNVDDIARAIALAGERPGGGLIAVPDGFTVANRAAVIERANTRRVPAIYSYRFFASEGGLVAYGFDADTQYRGAASYVDRIRPLTGRRANSCRPTSLPGLSHRGGRHERRSEVSLWHAVSAVPRCISRCPRMPSHASVLMH